MSLSPNDATLAIRAAATINQAALCSVVLQLAAQLEEVESWPNSPAKGRMREMLQRTQQSYRLLADRSGEVIRTANQMLAMTGGANTPNPPVAPNTWSTGTW